MKKDKKNHGKMVSSGFQTSSTTINEHLKSSSMYVMANKNRKIQMPAQLLVTLNQTSKIDPLILSQNILNKKCGKMHE